MEATKDQQYISPLNRSLRVFFGDAWRTCLRDPTQAYFFFRTVQRQRKAAGVRAALARQGVHVPPIIIYSITDRCNLHCKGCYARSLRTAPNPELDSDKMTDIVREARDLGVSFMVLAGGEPLVRPEILDIARAFPDVVFFVFTNGLLINEAMAERLRRLRNVVPIVSMEGYEEDTDGRRGEGVYRRLTSAMRTLKDKGVFFGTSLTVTSSNFATLTDARFVKGLNGLGCRLFFFVEYSPVKAGTEAWVITDEQRIELAARVASLRSRFRALFISVPGDEQQFGGCLSAGRGFVHISAQGDVEPCPFVPYSDANLRESSLKAALQSRFLVAVRENSDRLGEGKGACALWKEREWLGSLLGAGANGNRVLAPAGHGPADRRQ